MSEKNQIEKYIEMYFGQRKSFLITEVMTLYLASDDSEIKLRCLELLSKIEG